MPAKRGRPISSDTTDAAILLRRQRTAERTKRYRQQKAAASQQQQQTQQQLQQAEAVAERPFEDQEAAQTLLALGLRVQNVVLAQDASDAQLQRDAIPVDEHNVLYDENEPVVPLPSASTTPTRSQQQPDLSQFFQTLPSRNPFALLSSPPPPPSPPHLIVDDTADIPAISTTNQENIRNNDEEIREDNGRDGLDSAFILVDEEVRSQQIADEETSPHNSILEHSEHSSDAESEITETSAHDHAVGKLYEQLQGGFHGCSEEQHRERLQEHLEHAGDNHYGLGEIFNDGSFPSVLGLTDLISTERLARQQFPAPAQWGAVFCGIPPQRHRRNRHPMNVCLHTEETQAAEPQVAFDIDSFLAFGSSLSLARQGLWYQPAPQMRQNMTTDVHLKTDVFEESTDPEQPTRSHLAMLRDVPHFLLGRVVGAHDITVHILFPHLSSTEAKFVSLTKDQLSRWIDGIFHPAVHRYYDAHYTQHLPASYRHGLANSRAHQVEGRQIETASYQAQQSIGYHLQPEYLNQIWEDILDRITDTPGFSDFREPQLFFSAKGTKLQFKTSPSRPTMLDAMENFQAYLERIIDFDFVHLDRLYVDIGKEICPRVSLSLLSPQRGHVGDEAQVYQWRRCCLEHYIRWMYDGEPPSAKGRGQRYFAQNMLYEAASLTSVAPKHSKLREGGLVYSQFYGSVKEVSDATKCFPFENDGLEELALDPQIRQGARHAAGGQRRDAKILERAYCASKRRANYALVDSRKKSFGIREEHRISWPLFQGLITKLRLQQQQEEDDDGLEIILLDCPSYAWSIKTEVYLNFLWRSADKFATGFEVVLARCRRELVTWEETKMMAMFLRCLRFVFGGHQIQRESGLWWSRRERSVGQPPRQRVWYGLGFCNTLRRYKYCWLEPRFDWGKLTFLSGVTDHVLFGNGMLRGQYLRRGGQVQAFFGATQQLELALEWIDKYQESASIRERLISWMVHICLRQFRREVFSSLQREVSEEHREEALQGLRPVCYEYLEEIMIDGVHLISGNRCDFKQAMTLGNFLFHFNDGRTRTHWEDRPYRKLYRRARTALKMRDGPLKLEKNFSSVLLKWLLAYHWILPYPNSDVLLQTTKRGQRMWYSIEATGVPTEELEDTDPSKWEWGRKSWRDGAPSSLPEYIEWTKDEWVDWIRGQREAERRRQRETERRRQREAERRRQREVERRRQREAERQGDRAGNADEPETGENCRGSLEFGIQGGPGNLRNNKIPSAARSGTAAALRASSSLPMTERTQS